MIPIEKKGARYGLALLGAAALFAPGAAAAVQPAYGTTPDDPLSRNLKVIADSPHNVGALVGAGKAALDLGDAQGALTFFARAEQDAPRDGWVKKWMGSALVQLEQPAAALKFFRDAVSLGLPETSVAGDRGLAWDISGDPRRAQRDYRLALSAGRDDEITRRLALSLAISGERDQALQLIEDQVMQRDRAALRTRALVLALTGDREGADRAVETAMPGGQAAALEPFLARLPSLSLADRALAVHLGHFPGTGRAAAPVYAQNVYGGGLPAGYTPTPSGASPSAAAPRNRYSMLDAGRPDESRPAFGSAVIRPESASTEPRRIPGAQSEAGRQPPMRGQAQAAAPVTSEWSWSRGEPATTRMRTRVASGQTVASQTGASQTGASQTGRRPEPAQSAPPPEPRPVEIADARPVAPAPASVRETHTALPHSAQTAAPQPAVHNRLADVAAELDRIDEQQRLREVAAGVPPAGTRMSSHRTAAATPAPKPAKKKAPPEPREPARHWVQLGHGGSSTLSAVFERLKDKAPKLLAGRTAWVAVGDPNRLVVGPFASDDAAQSFADRLGKADLTALAWTSDAGQKVEKLSDR